MDTNSVHCPPVVSMHLFPVFSYSNAAVSILIPESFSHLGNSFKEITRQVAFLGQSMDLLTTFEAFET